MSKISSELLNQKHQNHERDYNLDDLTDSGDIHHPISGSYFDLSFKPAGKFTYKTIVPQVLACVSAASFHLPVGLVVAYSAILLDQLEVTPDPQIRIDDEKASWIASATVLVVPGAAVLTGFLVDFIGRINTLKSASIPYILGWLLIANATDVATIIIGRFLTGFAIAMATSPAAVYITEVARPDLRGALICLGPSMTSFGMVLVYLAGCFLHWRTVAWINIGFVTLPILLMYLFSPESPTWLVSRGRHADAVKSCKIISMDKAKDVIHKRRVNLLEREHVRKSITPTEGVMRKFISSITKPTVFKPFCILTMCFFFQQASGVYIFVFYTVKVFKVLNNTGNQIMDPNLLSVIVALIRMFVGFITSQLLYKFGRRILCLSSLSTMAVIMFISGGTLTLVRQGYIGVEYSVIPIIFTLLYICMSTMGLLSIPWTMTAEMYPMEVRGIMQGVSICVAHLFMFGVIKTFYSLMNLLGGIQGLLLFYGGICSIGTVMLWIFLPETHKKTLDEIEEYFTHNMIYLLRKKSIYKDHFPVKTVDDTENPNV